MRSPAADREVEITLTVSSSNSRRSRSGLRLGLHGGDERMRCEAPSDQGWHETSCDSAHACPSDWTHGYREWSSSTVQTVDPIVVCGNDHSLRYQYDHYGSSHEPNSRDSHAGAQRGPSSLDAHLSTAL